MINLKTLVASVWDWFSRSEAESDPDYPGNNLRWERCAYFLLGLVCDESDDFELIRGSMDTRDLPRI